MTGHGGWPLNVFLTPEQMPFYGGTYFPPEPRHGMPAWTQVLQAIAESWSENGEEIRAGGERLRERLSGGARLRPSTEPIDAARARRRGRERCADAYDARDGGFGGAPKFPQASVDRVPAAARASDDGARHPARDGRRRDPRPARRRLRPLQRRRRLDGAALREDALRQRAARARLPARLAGLRRAAACARSAATRSTGRCARCAGRRAASTRRSTPTPRASRGASTCGRSPSCASCWARTPTPRSPGSARASRGTSSTRTTPSRG